MQYAESVREVVNCNKLNEVPSLSSVSYTAPTALGIRQEVEQIRLTFFYSAFFTFLTFLFFIERFYIYACYLSTLLSPCDLLPLCMCCICLTTV